MPTLNWIGKDKVITHHQDVPFRVLEHKYGFTANGGMQEAETDSGNMIIHGDNLVALKSLLPEYEGRIDCIYIDPPYNTGNEGWVYNDNVNEPHIKKWLGEVVGKQGEDLSRHDKWLCMMYPRLRLLEKLLSNNGTIFISIDDYEQASLKIICDEIFGLNNLVANCVWQKKTGAADAKGIATVTEYILCYCKNISGINYLFNSNEKAFDIKRYRFKDEFINERGPFYYDSLDRGSIRYSDSQNYPIYSPNGDPLYPNGRTLFINDGWTWKWSAEKVKWGLENGFISIVQNPQSKNGWSVKYKIYLNVDNEGKPITKSVPYKNLITNILNADASKLLKEVFVDKIFDYSKPVELIEYLLSFIVLDNDAIILDSFAGSGTTAHAVLRQNEKDQGNRKFILIEMMDYAESITAERVKRVMSGYNYKGKKEEEIYSQKLTPKNLLKGEALLKEANEAIEENRDKYDKVSKPKIVDNCLKVTGTKVYADKMPGLGGSFDYYELGEPLFDKDGFLNEAVGIDKIREYVYYSETGQPIEKDSADGYLLGNYHHTDYYFYYEPQGETTFGPESLSVIQRKADSYIVYADMCLFSKDELARMNIVYKKIPRDIRKF